MSNLAEQFGIETESVPEEESLVDQRSISPFDFINQIFYGKENLIVDDWSEHQYNPYIVNLGLSFGADTILYANEMNIRPNTPKKMQHDYLFHSIPPKKRFYKWEKKEKEHKNIQLLKQYYGFSNERAKEALKILTKQQIQEIQECVSTGGISRK